jgi:divalent metal cation (Fe/Co/Zn/Cd) transporter
VAGGEGVGYIFRALAANFLIAVSKGIGAVVTGSGAMLAETLHSLSDCVNQVLLLVGLKQAKRPPSPEYPLGQGRNLYFWSFMVAMLLFLGGRSILRYLRESKDSDLVVIFGEDFAACLGLFVALVAVVLSWITGDPLFDALGTLGIGAVLVGVAVFLAIEVKSLLLGEAADSELTKKIETSVGADADVRAVFEVITVQQGPGEILVAMKVHFKSELSIDDCVRKINEIEKRLRAEMPELKWVFIEPDHPPLVQNAAA